MVRKCEVDGDCMCGRKLNIFIEFDYIAWSPRAWKNRCLRRIAKVANTTLRKDLQREAHSLQTIRPRKMYICANSDMKPHFSPLQKKEPFYEHPSRTPIITAEKVGKKIGEYNFQMTIASSAPYKELIRKLNTMKEEQATEKERELNELKEKDDELRKFKIEKDRL